MDQQPYTTVESVCLYLGIEVPSESSDLYIQIEQWILAMSSYIDRYCNRVIYREEEETVLYDGNGTDMLLISDVINPVVTVGGVARTVTTYPQRKTYASRIRLENGYRFNSGRGNVAVTGIHAMFMYLPDDVQLACNVLVAGIYNARTVQTKVGTTERIGNYSITYKDEAQKADYTSAMKLLATYRRIAF